MTPVAPPPHALLCWADSLAVYIELPCADGSFHRLTFPLSESGLSRALNLLRDRPKPEAPLKPAPAQPSSKFTADQLALADKLIRGMRANA